MLLLPTYMYIVGGLTLSSQKSMTVIYLQTHKNNTVYINNFPKTCRQHDNLQNNFVENVFVCLSVEAYQMVSRA